MCHFLDPSKELGQNMSCSTEISSCFYKEQYGTVKKRRRNRQKPPFLAFEKNYFFLQNYILRYALETILLYNILST